uniref:CSON014730 protein n=1 Tax=Culicoides sonorensis TaxID=179676 RepID=A0A336KT72_CULSO
MLRLGLYIATWTLFCSCSASQNIHLQMSPTQLQHVFHVDDINQVPNYELIKLTHLSTAHHVRKKRSIDSVSSSILSSSGSKFSGSDKNNLVSNHHVKKDLSKVPFDEKLNSIFGAEIKKEKNINKNKIKYSETSTSSSSSTTTTTEKVITKLHEINQNNKNEEELNEKIKISDIVSLRDIKEHKVSFNAFGEKLNLTLKPTEGLFKDGPQSLKMWHAHPDPNAADGINYEEISQVSSQMLNLI